MTRATYAIQGKPGDMRTNNEKEFQIAECFLKSFEEKSPLDYDILDSMFFDSKSKSMQTSKN